MIPTLNQTHDPLRRSWVESANTTDTDFPIQNLPFGVFRSAGEARGGIALGDQIIDLDAFNATGMLTGAAAEAARAAAGASLMPLLQQPAEAVSKLRRRLSDLFRQDSEAPRLELEATLVPMTDAELLLPVKPSAFTDFCASIDHIRRMGEATGSPPKLAWMALPVSERCLTTKPRSSRRSITIIIAGRSMPSPAASSACETPALEPMSSSAGNSRSLSSNSAKPLAKCRCIFLWAARRLRVSKPSSRPRLSPREVFAGLVCLTADIVSVDPAGYERRVPTRIQYTSYEKKK